MKMSILTCPRNIENCKYKLKLVNEDFIVEEQFKYEILENGKFIVFKLIKSNINTHDALKIISQKLKINIKDIGFAGLKDRKAVTIQYISIPDGFVKDILLDYDFSDEKSLLQLVKVGYRNERIYPGCLSSNKFEIVVRDLDDSVVDKFKDNNLPENYVNFFGEQRFSTYNNKIGKFMIKKHYKEALDLILLSFSKKYSEELQRHIDSCNENYLHALLKVDKKLLRLYLHAYQSELWNKSVQKYLEIKKIDSLNKLSDCLDVYIPMVGFDIEGDDEIVAIVEDIMDDEGLNLRDLLLRQFQGLGLEGGNRSLVNKATDVEIIDINNDELNSSKNKIVLSFVLPKGSYATEYVRQLFMS